MSCPVYNELWGDLFDSATQLENNFNNLNGDEKCVYLFSATDNICILSYYLISIIVYKLVQHLLYN